MLTRIECNYTFSALFRADKQEIPTFYCFKSYIFSNLQKIPYFEFTLKNKHALLVYYLYCISCFCHVDIQFKFPSSRSGKRSIVQVAENLKYRKKFKKVNLLTIYIWIGFKWRRKRRFQNNFCQLTQNEKPIESQNALCQNRKFWCKKLALAAQ